VLLSLVHNVNAPLPAQYKIARKKNVEKKREREREREREPHLWNPN
jgi:hypothetical protein